jgi:hypothetical protein
VKKCRTCGEAKPRSEFYPHVTARDGLHGSCKTCARQRMATWEKRNPGKRAGINRGWQARNSEKVVAQRALHEAVRRGVLSRPGFCEGCGRVGKVEGHHEDYLRHLDVAWLCRKCHNLADNRRRLTEAENDTLATPESSPAPT